jgi:hypothetical protein
MQTYDSRPMTLDPGLTVLALRGLRHADRHYPFLEQRTRWRRWRAGLAALREAVASWLAVDHR